MRLSEGIVVNDKETFGNLKFSALHVEVYERDEQGNATSEVRHRTYDLKSDAQGMMIQVILPPEAGIKDFAYNTPVRLVNVTVGAISNATFNGRADGNWYIKADDIVPIDAKAVGDTGKTGAATAGADVGKTGADALSAGTPQPPKKG